MSGPFWRAADESRLLAGDRTLTILSAPVVRDPPSSVGGCPHKSPALHEGSPHPSICETCRTSLQCWGPSAARWERIMEGQWEVPVMGTPYVLI